MPQISYKTGPTTEETDNDRSRHYTMLPFTRSCEKHLYMVWQNQLQMWDDWEWLTLLVRYFKII